MQLIQVLCRRRLGSDGPTAANGRRVAFGLDGALARGASRCVARRLHRRQDGGRRRATSGSAGGASPACRHPALPGSVSVFGAEAGQCCIDRRCFNEREGLPALPPPATDADTLHNNGMKLTSGDIRSQRRPGTAASESLQGSRAGNRAPSRANRASVFSRRSQLIPVLDRLPALGEPALSTAAPRLRLLGGITAAHRSIEPTGVALAS